MEFAASCLFRFYCYPHLPLVDNPLRSVKVLPSLRSSSPLTVVAYLHFNDEL